MHADPRPESSPLIVRLWSSSAVRYLVVGDFAFLFDIGVLWVLYEVFHVPLPISTPAAFLLSFVVTYTLQRTVAFRSSDSVAPSVVRYTILVAFNTVATTAIVWAIDAIGVAVGSGQGRRRRGDDRLELFRLSLLGVRHSEGD